MKALMIGLAAFLVAPALAQIPDYGGAQKAEKMGKLDFMVGEWEGTGWADRGGQRSEFKSYELVEKKAGGTVLVVTGRHWIEIPGRDPMVVHDACGLISWDPKLKGFTMTAHLANGLTAPHEIVEGEMSYKWTNTMPDGSVTEYEATFTEDTWVEKGFSMIDGKRTQWFEMSLKRKK